MRILWMVLFLLLSGCGEFKAILPLDLSSNSSQSAIDYQSNRLGIPTQYFISADQLLLEDMIIDPNELVLRDGMLAIEESGVQTAGNTRGDYWHNEVPIKFATNIAPDIRADFKRACEDFGVRCTCYRGQRNYISVKMDGARKCSPRKACAEFPTGGETEIHLSDFIGYYNPYQVIAHELGHSLGLVHEHQRSDRNEHVASFSGSGSNFQFLGTRFGPFDYESIMLYPCNEVQLKDSSLCSYNGFLRSLVSAGDIAAVRATRGATNLEACIGSQLVPPPPVLPPVPLQATVRVTVLDADTEAPIAGSEVFMYSGLSASGPIYTARSDEAGVASLTLPTGIYILRTVAGNYNDEFQSDFQHQSDQTITVHLRSSGSLQGTPQINSGTLEICLYSVNNNNLPVQGITISLAGPENVSDRTDSTGCVRGNLKFGNYTATAILPGFQDLVRPLIHNVTNRAISVRLNVPLIICLVRDDNSLPIPGVSISLSGPANLSQVTEADGCIEANNLPFGTYAARASYPGFQDIDGPLTFSPTQNSYGFRVRIRTLTAPQPTTGRLTIRVVDSATGANILGARVTIGSAFRDTDANGVASDIIPFALYPLITITKDGYTTISVSNFDFRADRSEIVSMTRPTTNPPPVTNGRLTIRVVDNATGANLQGARVTIGSEFRDTDANGVVSDIIPFALYPLITIAKSGYNTISVTNFDFRTDRSETVRMTATVVTPPPVTNGSLTIRVVDNATGANLQGARVTIGSAFLDTDANGVVSDIIPFDLYPLITIAKSGYNTISVTNFDFRTDRSETVRMTAVVVTPPPVTSGNLTICITYGGVAVPSAILTGANQTTGQPFSVTTEENGCVTRDAPFGSYSGTASKDGQSAPISFTHVSGGTNVTIDIPVATPPPPPPPPPPASPELSCSCPDARVGSTVECSASARNWSPTSGSWVYAGTTICGSRGTCSARMDYPGYFEVTVTATDGSRSMSATCGFTVR